ncbi:MAG: RNase adapter RapZ [Alphaproteobacteria bacterium]
MDKALNQHTSKDARADRPASAPHLLMVTGLSGAGKTSALKALEDLGYEAVDNLPLSLLSVLVGQVSGLHSPLAVGVDIRTRDFGIGALLGELEALIANPKIDAKLLFLDCDDAVLQRRFTETRRRHPLAGDRPLMDGITHERTLLAPLRERADPVIDTTEMTLGDLHRMLEESFGLAHRPGLAIFVTSFAYRHGLPREADLVFDARFLKNPYYDLNLRQLTGRDAAVGAFVTADSGFAGFFEGLTAMLLPLLPRFESEGKSYLTIAVGCTGGRHRSVYIAERLAALLDEGGHRVRLRHRDIERGAAGEDRRESEKKAEGSGQ